jgi:hypothetical protein
LLDRPIKLTFQLPRDLRCQVISSSTASSSLLIVVCFGSLDCRTRIQYCLWFYPRSTQEHVVTKQNPRAAGCVHPFPAVRLRGLPFGSSREEIADFLEVRPIDIVFQERGGRPNGVAFVLTANIEDYQRCIDKDKQNLGSRYIEVFPCARSVCCSLQSPRFVPSLHLQQSSCAHLPLLLQL